VNWLFFSLISYFLGALAVVLDKFLLGSKRISSPPVYTFYIALLGLITIFLFPYYFYIPSIPQIILSIISGSLFTFGILALYFAIQKGEASRVTPVIGAVAPLLVYFISFFLGGASLGAPQAMGIWLLIFGGLLISFDLPLNISKKKFVAGFYPALAAGVLLAISSIIYKYVYAEQSFINGFIWTRIGAFFGVAALFLVPCWRKDIVKSVANFRKPKKQSLNTGALFVTNKIIGGTSSILFHYAIALGSVTLVNSLVSVQYVFVLMLAVIFSRWYPFIFREKLYFWDWAQKIAAIACIALGVYLVSYAPNLVFF
jgi:uncharacterized membrane protein